MSHKDVENVYREFITEAKKLHDEIMKLDNEIQNPFREVESLLTDELTVYWLLGHGRVGIREYVLLELDDLIVRCHQLDLFGKSEDTFENCKRTVFGD